MKRNVIFDWSGKEKGKEEANGKPHRSAILADSGSSSVILN